VKLRLNGIRGLPAVNRAHYCLWFDPANPRTLVLRVMSSDTYRNVRWYRGGWHLWVVAASCRSPRVGRDGISAKQSAALGIGNRRLYLPWRPIRPML